MYKGVRFGSESSNCWPSPTQAYMGDFRKVLFAFLPPPLPLVSVSILKPLGSSVMNTNHRVTCVPNMWLQDPQ